MFNTFKREFVIAQLRAFGVKDIDGKAFEQVTYRELLAELAKQRATKQ